MLSSASGAPVSSDALAEHALVHQLAAARHLQQRVRQQAAVDVALGQEAVDARQPLRAQAFGFGAGGLHRRVLCEAGRGPDHGLSAPA